MAPTASLPMPERPTTASQMRCTSRPRMAGRRSEDVERREAMDGPSPTRCAARSPRWSTVGLVAIALAFGIAIAVIDSSPHWDDTGVTIGSLVIGAGVIAGIAGRRPWLWALLVGAPAPVLEIAMTGNTGALLALVFASIGAVSGWAVRRTAVRPDDPGAAGD
jgi:hypothetical protein